MGTGAESGNCIRIGQAILHNSLEGDAGTARAAFGWAGNDSAAELFGKCVNK